MLYQFLLNFVDSFGFLNVFKYLTFRTGLSFFTSLTIVLFIGGPFIKLFSNKKIFNPIRDDGPEDHIVKKIGTPTMGGVIILFGLLISVLFWADLSNINILFCIYVAISFGVLGAFDDYKKIKQSNSSGISSKLKLISQILLAIIGVGFYVYLTDYQDINNLYFPFFKNLIKGPPIKRVINNDVKNAKPVLKVIYLNTFKKENKSTYFNNSSYSIWNSLF